MGGFVDLSEKKRKVRVNGKDIFNVHWPNSLGLIEGFCTVCPRQNTRCFADGSARAKLKEKIEKGKSAE